MAVMDPYRVMVVCTGNICRSPMAEVVLRDRIDAAGLGDDVVVDSTGISDEEHGNPIDRRAQAALRNRGYDVPARRARQITGADAAESDLVLPMTAAHSRAIRRITPGTAENLRMFRSFDPAAPRDGADHDLDVADPWYGGPEDFELCLDEIEAAADGVVDFVRSELARTEAAR